MSVTGNNTSSSLRSITQPFGGQGRSSGSADRFNSRETTAVARTHRCSDEFCRRPVLAPKKEPRPVRTGRGRTASRGLDQLLADLDVAVAFQRHRAEPDDLFDAFVVRDFHVV